MSVEEYRRKADEFLRRAERTTDLRMRGLVLEEALFWHHLALEAYVARVSGRPAARAEPKRAAR